MKNLFLYNLGQYGDKADNMEIEGQFYRGLIITSASLIRPDLASHYYLLALAILILTPWHVVAMADNDFQLTRVWIIVSTFLTIFIYKVSSWSFGKTLLIYSKELVLILFVLEAFFIGAIYIFSQEISENYLPASILAYFSLLGVSTYMSIKPIADKLQKFLTIQGCSFTQVTLYAPKITRCRMQNISLLECKVINGDIYLLDLDNSKALTCDFKNSFVRYAVLNKVIFSQVNFPIPNFHSASECVRNTACIFMNSRFHYCSLSECQFVGCDLRDSQFFRCEFVSCNFSSVDVRNVDFRFSSFTDSLWQGAIYSSTTKWPRGFDPDKHGCQMEDNS